MEKTKYSDNRLAEELDAIVLVNNALLSRGFPSGTCGTLTYSYTGKRRPFYALLYRADGVRAELPLRLRDFRVLNEEKRRDRLLMAEYAVALSAAEHADKSAGGGKDETQSKAKNFAASVAQSETQNEKQNAAP